MDQFTCSASSPNLVLFQCEFSTLINEINCDDNDDVGISCCELKGNKLLK